MNVEEIVMGGLALLNAAAVLVVMRSGVLHRRTLTSEPALDVDASLDSQVAAAAQEAADASGAAVEQAVDDGLFELVEEAERRERIDAGQLRGEARLAAELGRWRARGEDRPRAAESCRTGTGP